MDGGDAVSGRGGRGRGRVRGERRRWVVDAIEAGIATVEEDGQRVVRVPCWLLPDDAREGSVLLVTREMSRGASVVRVERDVEGERAALERSRRQVASDTGDQGGDVVL